MKLKGVDATFRELGFNILSREKVVELYENFGEVKLNLKVYERQLSQNVSLFVESSFQKGNSTYMYSFYRMTYSKETFVQVFGDNLSPSLAVSKVKKMIERIENNNKEIIIYE
ncbi:hypothetical protein [Carnobacterium maltaromaticum]|uniref:hypothetical protein n=1 Tax=Carnobacterium maltaromaticum TaxID=2751 RepID=UPI0039BDE80B